MLRKCSFILVWVFCVLAFVPTIALAANSAKNLTPEYRHWLEEQVPYIITSEERKQFLGLTTDEQRDSFIAAFWRVRDPDPGTTVNTYKEEHYRRLAYANDHFGDSRYHDGWRTAMGRIYITLGAPKQRAPYHEKANVRPMEIWFYESESPALPPYFNVLFYKHSAAEEWRLYSPSQDGPVDLVTTGESQNSNKFALKLIRNSLGDEVAKTTCSLIPSDSVNFDNFSPTMSSDLMLATIIGLADNPLNKERLYLNRMRERVTTSLFTGEAELTVGYAVSRDEQGRTMLSYLAWPAHADSRAVGRRTDGSSYYDQTLRTLISTSDGKQVYQQEDQLTGKLTEAQAATAKQKRFAVEARIPLVPGNYTLEATLTNNVDHVAARKKFTVTVPAADRDLVVSPLLAYGNPAAVADPKGLLPFSMSGLRFTPHGAQTVELRQGSQMPLAFQLWLGQGTASQTGVTESEKVTLRYVFGSVSGSHQTPVEEREEIDVSNHDKSGNLLTGHKLDTSSLQPGTYRLVVSANRGGDHHTAYSALNIKVIPADQYVEMWTAYGATDPEGQALDDLKRGMSAEAQGQDIVAKNLYREAMTEAPNDSRVLARLTALLARRGEVADLAGLGEQPVLTHDALEPGTVVPIAIALRAQGKAKQAIALIEAQSKIQPPSTELQKELANAYEAAGNAGRAKEIRAESNAGH